MKNGAVRGVQFLVDERGQKTAVLIDLKKNAALLEDIYDAALARCRARLQFLSFSAADGLGLG